MLKIFVCVPLVKPDKTLQLFQILPFPILNSLRPNNSISPKLEKDFVAVGKTQPFPLKKLQEVYSCKNIEGYISVKADS
jgi:hypothetical protein